MKITLLILMVFHLLLITLKAGDRLDIKETGLKNSTLYELQLHTKDKVQTIWSREVPLINGKKPADECDLWLWEKNERGLIVVVTYDGFEGRFLQFDINQKLMTELYMGTYWIKQVAKGSKLKLEPPDKIWLDNKGTIVNEFKIKNGVLYDKDGKDCSTLQYIKVNPGLPPDK